MVWDAGALVRHLVAEFVTYRTYKMKKDEIMI